MGLVEFIDFGAKLIMWLILIRGAQLLGKNTWVAPALGAIHC